MGLLDTGTWHSRIYSSGWVNGSGGDYPVIGPATIPFGGVGASGNGGRLGGARANLEAFTETQWVTVRADLPAYPF